MKLNPDCIRDIMLFVEERCDMESRIDFCEIYSVLNDKYEQREIDYHIDQCNQNGFFNKVYSYIDGSRCLDRLTPKGHEFIENIRSATVWAAVKDKAGKIGSFSIDVLTKIAVSVVTHLINSTL